MRRFFAIVFVALSLGTAACPPYHLAIVIGGTSAEATLKTVKLASAGYLDHLPTEGNRLGQAFRDLAFEEKVVDIARKSGIGAQFGGKYFALDARVIRLPRHGASCPVGIGVSCSADRNIKAKINREGLWLGATGELLLPFGASNGYASDLEVGARAMLTMAYGLPIFSTLISLGAAYRP